MTTSRYSPNQPSGFTLVELIVVMAIITILISVGAVGIGRMDEAQKTNTSIALVEALTNEAQRMAVGQNTKTRLCIVNDTDDLDRHLRYFAIAVFNQTTSVWEINSRGSTIPNGVFFDPVRSNNINTTGIGTHGTGAAADPTFPGKEQHGYYYYEFNSQGICVDGELAGATPGAGLVLIGGYLAGNNLEMKGNDKVGFVIWRNGSTSKIRNVNQITEP